MSGEASAMEDQGVLDGARIALAEYPAVGGVGETPIHDAQDDYRAARAQRRAWSSLHVEDAQGVWQPGDRLRSLWGRHIAAAALEIGARARHAAEPWSGEVADYARTLESAARCIMALGDTLTAAELSVDDPLEAALVYASSIALWARMIGGGVAPHVHPYAREIGVIARAVVARAQEAQAQWGREAHEPLWQATARDPAKLEILRRRQHAARLPAGAQLNAEDARAIGRAPAWDAEALRKEALAMDVWRKQVQQAREAQGKDTGPAGVPGAKDSA